MNSFDFSDNNYDQYYVDVESRYPTFSDVYAGEYDYITGRSSNVKTDKPAKPEKSTSPIEKVRESIQNKIQDSISKNNQIKKLADSTVEKFMSTEPIDIQINQNTIIFLVFVMIIFLFCMCFKMMTEMRAEIKLLRKLMKKSIV
jgi:hypothetical protein